MSAAAASEVPKYDTGVLLGTGGMADVYYAVDRVLGRPVALKFLRREDPIHVERLFREARAQAKIEHELVCKVYEVGKLGDRAYIAMQYIDGVRLDVAAPKLTLEQKVMIVRDVADAVHAAHRVGLVHRDLKPGNILVENNDGAWRPYVTDFGLVRDASATDLTTTGETIGTPSYMAPEQARGAVHLLDRRTDVYSLGAVLYELLAGRPPFVAASPVEILVNVLHTPPTSLRKLQAGIPRTLETIAMKCLEKDPDRRYASARALAEDLQRHLDGDPIHASPPTRLARALVVARRNKFAVAGFAIALAAIAAGLVTWRSTRERAASARRFGEQVQRIESALQIARLLPIHDVSRDVANVRSEIASIERDAADDDGLAHYAIGRGYLALHDNEQARVQLERAWELGPHTGELAVALGRAFSALYQAALDETTRFSDANHRDTATREAQRSLRDPALQYLAAAGDAVADRPALVEALIASYDGRADEALARTTRMLAESPAQPEALALAGDLHTATARAEIVRGHYDVALRELEQAGRGYEGALAIARSDAMLYVADCRRWFEVMTALRFRSESPRAAFDSALVRCEQARQIEPARADADLWMARVWSAWGEWQAAHGDDPRPSQRHAIDAARLALDHGCPRQDVLASIALGELRIGAYERVHGIDASASLARAIAGFESALLLAPNDATSRNALGNAHENVARAERTHGRDPIPAAERAIANYREAIRIDPKFVLAYNNLGNVLSIEAQRAADQGRDPRPGWTQTLAAYQQALAIDASSSLTYNNVGVVSERLANYLFEHGTDASADIERAVAAYQRAMELEPNQATAIANLASSYLTRAAMDLTRGRPASPWLDRADELVDKGLAVDRGLLELLDERVQAASLRVEQAFRDDLDPTAAWERARTSCDAALAVDANAMWSMDYRGEAAIPMARWALAHKRSPQGALDDGARMIAKAIALDDKRPSVHADRASLELVAAQWRLARGEPVAIEAGLAAVDRALALDATAADALATRGSLELVAAHAEHDPVRRADHAARAKDALASAIERDRWLDRELGPQLRDAEALCR